MIETKIDFSKANDFAWLQSRMADANSHVELNSAVSRCIYSDDVPHQSFDDCLSGKPITFD